MITVSALRNTLEEMKTIYPFNDEKTMFRLSGNPIKCHDSVVEIKTVDEETGIEVIMAKDAWKGSEENAFD